MKSVNKGSQNPMAILTEAKVKRIRELAKPPAHYKYKDLAKLFKVSYSTIRNVVCYEIWAHVD